MVRLGGTQQNQPLGEFARNPMTYEEVADRFSGNADFAKWPNEKAESVIEPLENAPDLTRMAAAVSH